MSQQCHTKESHEHHQRLAEKKFIEQYKAHHSFLRRTVKHLRIHYKRAIWRIVIQSSRLVKRCLDISLSLIAIFAATAGIYNNRAGDSVGCTRPGYL